MASHGPYSLCFPGDAHPGRLKRELSERLVATGLSTVWSLVATGGLDGWTGAWMKDHEMFCWPRID